MLSRYILLYVFCLLALPLGAHSQSADFTPPDPDRDALVERCLNTEGVGKLAGTDVICYNSAIFPEQFLKLNTLAPARQIIITSPGGNVATARGMSAILDRRGEPAIIAGPCMSACAMVILPGLDAVYIHRSAHIAVHGITHMPYRTWFGWLKAGAKPSSIDLIRAQMGYDFDYISHVSLADHVAGHLGGQDVGLGFIKEIDAVMSDSAKAHDCKVDPKQYWGMLTSAHIRAHLGNRLTGMEAFAQSWDDPNNLYYRDVIKPIGPRTYIFKDAYEKAVC